MTGLRWWWRRWRAAHYLWAAEQTMRANPCLLTMHAWWRARDFLAHIDAARP